MVLRNFQGRLPNDSLLRIHQREGRLVTKTVLITDLDNTLFDWFGVWYACNSAMLSKVCAISGLDKGVILPEIKAVHQRHGTAEYAFLLQELPSLQHLYGTPERIMEVMDEAVHAFNSERKRRLKLYPTVLDTLNSLKDQGVLVIAYTESKSFYTAYRVKKLGLDRFLYSPPDHEEPDGFIGTRRLSENRLPYCGCDKLV